jgi:hypothetical protein
MEREAKESQKTHINLLAAGLGAVSLVERRRPLERKDLRISKWHTCLYSEKHKTAWPDGADPGFEGQKAETQLAEGADHCP